MLLSSVFLTVILLRKGVFTKSTGDKLDAWLKNPVGNPEEIGNYFEGDIILVNKRAGWAHETKKWPKGIIPYEIAEFTPRWRTLIVRAMKTISSRTCIKFIPKRDKDKDYVRITNKHAGCNSYMGRAGGTQLLNLQIPACFRIRGTAIHELLHTVGLFHEHNRYDRDDYVKIQWENISKGKSSNFNKTTAEEASLYGIEYNYGSIMHYGRTSFSKNKKPTIVSLEKGKDRIMGQRKAMADSDVRKVNAMYGCPK